MKKIFVLILACLLICMQPISTQVKAESLTPVPYSSYTIQSVTCSYNSTSCRLTYNFMNLATGHLTATLQKKSGSSWIDMGSAYKEFTRDLSTSCTVTATNKLVKGSRYRIRTQVVAQLSGMTNTYYETTFDEFTY